MDEAACAGEDLETFFPEDKNGLQLRGEEYEKIAKVAISLCKKCEVQNDCLEFALRESVYGIWGGTRPNERRKMKDKSRRSFSRHSAR